RSRNDGPVPEMDAVEIAHRHHGSPGDRGRSGGVADHNKTGRHFVRSLEAFSATAGRRRDRDATPAAKSSRAKIDVFRQVYTVSAPGRLTGCLRADASGWGGLRGIWPSAGAPLVLLVGY